MSGYTPNLNLFEYNPTTDGNQTLNIKNALNDNFDKIDTYCKGLSDDKADTDDVNTALALKADKTVLHALKGYSDNGELLTDAEGLADVKNYAHSTFDLSKFTVVGSPTITDDGILLSQQDRTMMSTIAFDTITMADDFDIISPVVKVVDANMNREQYFWNDSTNTFRMSFTPNYDSDTIGFRYIDSNNSFKRLYTPILNKQNGDSYQIKISKRSGTIQLYYKKNNSEWLQGDATVDFLTTPTIVGFKTKQSTTDIYSITTNAELDLKYASVVINGVEVFSGNKTGIDTIKPDDYTVVGTPAISADGVASGFSDSNYLTISPFMNVPQSLRITGEFNFPLNSNSQTLMACFNGSTFLRLKTQNGRVYVQNCINNNYELNFATSTANYYGKHTLDFIYKDNNVKISLDGDVVYSQSLTLDLTVLTQVSCGIGKMLGVNDWYALGSIDLNAFKIYVDGNLVYQPCLKIPYTESAEKYGSKIVNAVYRDRVQDAWQQNYSQRYYTLDEANNNYTLPAGELYGMIESCLNIDNPTTSEKEIITSWGMPDYSTGVSINTNYIATYNGYVKFTLTHYGGNGSGYGYINGEKVAENATVTGQSVSGDSSAFLCPFVKGDKITFNYNGTYGGASAVVYKLRGEG